MEALLFILITCTAILCAVGRDPCLKLPPAEFSSRVVIAKANWDSAVINVEIARYLLEEQLGIGVDDPTLTEEDSFAALANNTVDAVLEVWPEGRKALLQDYVVTSKLVVDGGDLTSIGRIGWYVPKYVLDNCSDCDTYKGFRKAENAMLFATNATRPNSLGQFTGANPDYSNQDAELITNLRLRLELVFVGADNVLRLLDDAYGQKAPLLFYWWEPHSIHVRYNLTRVLLPSYSAELYSDERQQAGLIDCDYPPEFLKKLFSRRLQPSSPGAHAFLQQFQQSTLEQSQLMARVAYAGRTPAQAACEWIKANPERWKPWVAAGLDAISRAKPLSATSSASSSRSGSSLILLKTLVPAAVVCVLVIVMVAVVYCVYVARRTRRVGFAPRQGLVAIVFTDIQSSTRLWNLEPELMKAAIDTHHKLIREQLQELRGYEVKTVGDSFMCAFTAADNAVLFAGAVQLALVQHTWPIGLLRHPDATVESDCDGGLLFNGLRVRIGIHYGEPEVVFDSVTKGYDYYGHMVNVAARIEGVAHGGQTLVSADTVAALSEPVLSRVVLCEIGPVPLAGLEEPTTLVQVLPKELAARKWDPLYRVDKATDPAVPAVLVETPFADRREPKRTFSNAFQPIIPGGTSRASRSSPLAPPSTANERPSLPKRDCEGGAHLSKRLDQLQQQENALRSTLAAIMEKQAATRRQLELWMLSEGAGRGRSLVPPHTVIPGAQDVLSDIN